MHTYPGFLEELSRSTHIRKALFLKFIPIKNKTQKTAALMQIKPSLSRSLCILWQILLQKHNNLTLRLHLTTGDCCHCKGLKQQKASNVLLYPVSLLVLLTAETEPHLEWWHELWYRKGTALRKVEPALKDSGAPSAILGQLWKSPRCLISYTHICPKQQRNTPNRSVRALEDISRTTILRETYFNSQTMWAYPEHTNMPHNTVQTAFSRRQLTTK